MIKLQRCLAFLLFACFCGTALADTPLYEEDPYDEITVIEPGSGNQVVKIKPLSPADRQYASKPKTEGKLVVYPLISPDTPREVLWKLVVKIDVFDQLILKKANELVADGKLVPLGMLEQLKEQRCRPSGGGGVTRKGGKEVLVRRLWPKHDSVLSRYPHTSDGLRVR